MVLSGHSQDAQRRVLRYVKRNEMLHEMRQKGPPLGHRTLLGPGNRQLYSNQIAAGNA